jgi:hypothetical protein
LLDPRRFISGKDDELNLLLDNFIFLNWPDHALGLAVTLLSAAISTRHCFLRGAMHQTGLHEVTNSRRQAPPKHI